MNKLFNNLVNSLIPLSGCQELVDFYRKGINLTEDEKFIINPSDIWEISLIKNIPLESLVKIGYSFKPLDFHHYLSVQISWFKKQSELLSSKLNAEPSSIQLIEYSESHNNIERCRVCYALNFPEKVGFNMDKYLKNKEITDLFLTTANLVHPEKYPYIEQISQNKEVA